MRPVINSGSYHSNMNKINLNTLKNSLNLITGCGSGLGKATLEWFLRNGSGPVLGIDKYYEHDYLESLELEAEHRNKIFLKTHDTFDDKVETSIEEFVSKYGTIDNVINVAGVSLSFLLHSKTSEEPYALHHAYDLSEYNTVGTFNVIRLASKFMVRSQPKDKDLQKPKCIINTSCLSTSSPTLGQSFYSASKSSIEAMTLCIARELSPFNIRCNTIGVGLMDTKLLHSSGDKVIQYINNISLCPKRVGHPNEFAHLVQAIVENQMLNGCCIKLDGGTRIGHLW